MLVMPSVNRMNSILPSSYFHSGKSVKISRSAEICDLALLYDNGICRKLVEISMSALISAMIEMVIETFYE